MVLLSGVEQVKSEVSGDGPEDAPILLLIDHPASNDKITGRCLSGAMGSVYLSQFRAAGIPRNKIRIESVTERCIPAFYMLAEHEKAYWREHCFERIKALCEQDSLKIVVPAGEEALRLVTNRKSLSKWHLSPLQTVEALGSKDCIPLLDPHYVMKIFKDIVYITFGARRIAQQLLHPRKPALRKLEIRPSLERFIEWKKAALQSEWLSLDIETGAGQITCIGFSVNPNEAICVQTLPKDCQSESEFYEVWKNIAELCESPIKKVNQNILYDATYLSRYGIRVRNIQHDTMAAMRFINPELKKGLDNCARIYSFEPYWKDEGKDWSNRQNMDELYTYNCKDASVSLEIALAQRQELRETNQLELFDNLVMKLWSPFAEMCWTGFPVRKAVREKLIIENEIEIQKYKAILDEASKEILGKEINPASNKQVKELLKAAGFRLPSKNGRETSDYEALCQLRLKAPASKILEALMHLSKEQKKRSSYLNYRFDEEKARMYFSLYINSTETGRAAGGTDPWDRGLNVQTIPRDGPIKSQFGYEKPKGDENAGNIQI